jgi:hypothetical protein
MEQITAATPTASQVKAKMIALGWMCGDSTYLATDSWWTPPPSPVDPG